MIEVYTADTPNGSKIPIALEELGLPYVDQHVDLGAGVQHSEAFLAINPDGRIPPIVDKRADPAQPLPVFESGAILLHLAYTYNGLIGTSPTARAATLGRLFLQVAGRGPNFGNTGYFLRNDPGNAMAVTRFQDEARRHLAVVNHRLSSQDCLNGECYSIADIAHFCWIRSAAYAGLDLADFPAAKSWVEQIENRAAVARGIAASRSVQ